MRRVTFNTKGKRLSWREKMPMRHKAGMIRSLLNMIDSATEDTNSMPVEAENPPKNANSVSQSWL